MKFILFPGLSRFQVGSVKMSLKVGQGVITLATRSVITASDHYSGSFSSGDMSSSRASYGPDASSASSAH